MERIDVEEICSWRMREVCQSCAHQKSFKRAWLVFMRGHKLKRFEVVVFKKKAF